MAPVLLFPRADDLFNHLELLDKGKPSERVGRKATGLISVDEGYGSGAAGQVQQLANVLPSARAKRLRGCCDENERPWSQEIFPQPAVLFGPFDGVVVIGMGARATGYADVGRKHGKRPGRL